MALLAEKKTHNFQVRRRIESIAVEVGFPREYDILTNPKFIEFKKTLIDALRAKDL